MEESIRSRRKGGALPNLQTKKSGPLLNLQKERELLHLMLQNKKRAPSQVVRGKRTELLSRRELLDHLARRFSVLRRSPLPLGRAFSLSQGRELLTIPSSSSKHGRELTIKKTGWSSSKLQNLTIEVLSSLRPATGNEKPSTSSNVMRKTRAPS